MTLTSPVSGSHLWLDMLKSLEKSDVNRRGVEEYEKNKAESHRKNHERAKRHSIKRRRAGREESELLYKPSSDE